VSDEGGGKAGPERAMMGQIGYYTSVKKLFPTDSANCRWDFFL
jgi:hypothetical protein